MRIMERILVVLLLFVLFLSLKPLTLVTAGVSTAPAPKPGVAVNGADFTWNADDAAKAKASFKQSSAKDKVIPATALLPYESKKSDASGDKISSNAHSGDFPGIYFYWNEKQKEDGILKVDPAIFDLFKEGKFYITAKNSNAYWDYWIIPEEGVATSAGYLLYQIPRYFMYQDKKNKTANDELKNINMIFIGGAYKDAWLIIAKDWFDEDGALVTSKERIEELNKLLYFDSNVGKLALGKNKIEIKDFAAAYFGKKLTVTESTIKGYAAKQNPLQITVHNNDELTKTIKFQNQKLRAKITIEKEWDILPGSVACEATFLWGKGDSETEDYNITKAGDTIEVNEGVYWFKEVPLSGFTAETAFKVVAVEAGGKYKVSFKNKEDRAAFKVSKEWVNEADLNAEELAGLTEQIIFSLNLGEYVLAPGIYALAETLPAYPWVFLGADNKTNYVITQVGITVNGEDSSLVNATADGEYTIVFTNKVVAKPAKASLTLNKVWVNKNGATISDETLLAQLQQRLSFTNGYKPGYTDIESERIVFREIPIEEFTYEGITFISKCVNITVTEANGKSFVNNSATERGVDFMAETGQEYIVTFENEVDAKPYNTGDDFIPSKQHFDRWWSYGVLCYSSSTDQDVDYFVAFDDEFWLRNEYALIGFGNNVNSINYEAYFDAYGWKITQTSTGQIVNAGSYVYPFYVPATLLPGHYFTDGAAFWGGYAIKGLIGTDAGKDSGNLFANVFGSGGRQAYRLTIKPLFSPLQPLGMQALGLSLDPWEALSNDLIISYWDDLQDIYNNSYPVPLSEVDAPQIITPSISEPIKQEISADETFDNADSSSLDDFDADDIFASDQLIDDITEDDNWEENTFFEVVLNEYTLDEDAAIDFEYAMTDTDYDEENRYESLEFRV